MMYLTNLASASRHLEFMGSTLGPRTWPLAMSVLSRWISFILCARWERREIGAPLSSPGVSVGVRSNSDERSFFEGNFRAHLHKMNPKMLRGIQIDRPQIRVCERERVRVRMRQHQRVRVRVRVYDAHNREACCSLVLD